VHRFYISLTQILSTCLQSCSINHEQITSEEFHTTITPVIQAVNCCLIEGTTPQQPFRLLAAFSEIGYYSLSNLTAPFSTPVACAHFTAFMPYLLCLVQHIHSTSPEIHIISTTMPILPYRHYNSGTITKSVTLKLLYE